MNVVEQVLSWWRSGDVLMPVMFLVAVLLYTLLVERTLTFWSFRCQQHSESMLADLSIVKVDALLSGLAVARGLTVSLPLLGLLGTVTGMVDTFAQLGGSVMHPSVQVSHHASAGIGVALTTTQYGMALAIPAVVWLWFLSRWVESLLRQQKLSTEHSSPMSCSDPQHRRGT